MLHRGWSYYGHMLPISGMIYYLHVRKYSQRDSFTMKFLVNELDHSA